MMGFTKQDWDAWNAAFPEVEKVVKQAQAASQPVVINVYIQTDNSVNIQAVHRTGSSPARLVDNRQRLAWHETQPQSYAERMGAAYLADPNYGQRPMTDWEYKLIKEQSNWG